MFYINYIKFNGCSRFLAVGSGWVGLPTLDSKLDPTAKLSLRFKFNIFKVLFKLYFI